MEFSQISDKLQFVVLLNSSRWPKPNDKLKFVGLLAIAFLSNVSMHSVRIKPALAQATRQGVSHHHRAMTPAGATDANRDIRLSLAFVKR
jgi:hypothetical protein